MTTALSIVTVVKDDPSGLQRTLDSLARCDPFDLDQAEWIVIDSSQDSGAVPDLVASSPLPAVVHWVAPEGVYEAMNAGLSRVRENLLGELNTGAAGNDMDAA